MTLLKNVLYAKSMTRCENLPELPNVFKLEFLFSAATEAEPPGSTSATLDCDKLTAGFY